MDPFFLSSHLLIVVIHLFYIFVFIIVIIVYMVELSLFYKCVC